MDGENPCTHLWLLGVAYELRSLSETRRARTGCAFARRVEFERGEDLERVSDTENVDLCVCVCGERKMRERGDKRYSEMSEGASRSNQHSEKASTPNKYHITTHRPHPIASNQNITAPTHMSYRPHPLSPPPPTPRLASHHLVPLYLLLPLLPSSNTCTSCASSIGTPLTLILAAARC
jgi:hypothetical protein